VITDGADDRGGLMGKVDLVLLFALGISLIANLWLFYLWRQTDHLAQLVTRKQLDPQMLPLPGSRIGELHLLGIGGERVDLKIGPDSLPLVIYVLSPTCSWCDLNRQNVDFLVSQTRDKYRFIGLSSTSKGMATYLSENTLPFPVYVLDPSFTNSAISMAATPRTLLFSQEGVFIRSWTGAYTGETKKQISSSFGIKFPK